MIELATLAGGCFWCTEAIFTRIKGVKKVTSGYTGGKVDQPTYEQVSSGTTGHAEAIQLEFDPDEVKYETILEVFFATHDPTTLNRRGNDVGMQYRSAIFYHNDQQQAAALAAKEKIPQAVTEITAFTNFFPAEVDHQKYYEINHTQPYCSLVIAPKIKKLLTNYGELVLTKYK